MKDLTKENVNYDIQQEADEAIRLLSNFVNRHHGQYEYLVKAMAAEHRTLQQSMTAFMLRWFRHLAALREGEFDLRNEASVKIARKIFANIEEASYGLPLI